MTCLECGSFQLIAVLRQPDAEPETLMEDLHGLVPEPPWWRPFKHAWWRELTGVLDDLEGRLLDGMRYPIAPTEAELGELLVDRS